MKYFNNEEILLAANANKLNITDSDLDNHDVSDTVACLLIAANSMIMNCDEKIYNIIDKRKQPPDEMCVVVNFLNRTKEFIYAIKVSGFEVYILDNIFYEFDKKISVLAEKINAFQIAHNITYEVLIKNGDRTKKDETYIFNDKDSALTAYILAKTHIKKGSLVVLRKAFFTYPEKTYEELESELSNG